MARNNSKSKQKTSMIKEQTAMYTPSIQPVEKYNEEVYTKIKIQDLILFGIYSVIKNGETCTYERLVAGCFHQFPKIFGFKRYQLWPDSLKFDRPLRTLREEGLIVGSVRDHFELTEFGEKIAEETHSVLENKGTIINRKVAIKGRSVDDKLIEYIKESEPFKKFLNNPLEFTLSDSEFRSFLRCTLETPKRVIKQNLEYYKNVAKSYNERQVLQFLSFCERRFLGKGDKKNG